MVNAHLETITLTYSILETGAYEVLSKSQNSTVLGQGGPFCLIKKQLKNEPE